jgi:plasmid stabilization system protein ParE
MAEVRWTHDALEDMQSVAEYIEKDSFKFSQIVIQAFFNSIEIF